MWIFSKLDFSERLFDSIRYWEPRRLLYNLVLLTLAVVCWGPGMLSGRVIDFFAGVLVLLAFAIPANLLYCTAYPVDLALQLTPWRGSWTRCRWLLFLCGTALASAIAIWVMVGDHMA
jgi:hypothetical protein